MAELDWRNPDDYSYLEDYDLHEWAWEFLRRNPEYRKAYFALEAVATSAMLQEMQEDSAKREMFWGRHFAATEPWGLRMAANPRHDFREARVFFTDRAGVGMPKEWKAPDPRPESLWPGYPATVVLRFDLNYSVDVLSEIAAEQLRQCAKHLHERFPDFEPLAPRRSVRPQRGQFLLYVRILDAELAGASDGKITQELFGDKDDPRRSMTKTRETARRMAAKGYRDLLLRPPHKVGLLGEAKGPDD